MTGSGLATTLTNSSGTGDSGAAHVSSVRGRARCGAISFVFLQLSCRRGRGLRVSAAPDKKSLILVSPGSYPLWVHCRVVGMIQDGDRKPVEHGKVELPQKSVEPVRPVVGLPVQRNHKGASDESHGAGGGRERGGAVRAGLVRRPGRCGTAAGGSGAGPGDGRGRGVRRRVEDGRRR